MVWFNENLRFRLCTGRISGWFFQMRPCTASPFNPINIPPTITTFSGWKDPKQK